MSRDKLGPTVRWSAEIQRELYTDFEERFPINGMYTALIVSTLREFLDRVEVDTVAQGRIRNEIYRCRVEGNIDTGGKPVPVRIPTSLYHRFVAIFPDFGATTWFMRTTLRSFIFLDRDFKTDINEIAGMILATQTHQPISLPTGT